MLSELWHRADQSTLRHIRLGGGAEQQKITRNSHFAHISCENNPALPASPAAKRSDGIYFESLSGTRRKQGSGKRCFSFPLHLFCCCPRGPGLLLGKPIHYKDLFFVTDAWGRLYGICVSIALSNGITSSR